MTAQKTVADPRPVLASESLQALVRQLAQVPAADQARLMIVNGFIEPFVRELPMEYAVELNRLIELEMEGSVG